MLTGALCVVIVWSMNGATLKRHRQAAGLTQLQLAERLDTTQPQICRWEQSGVHDTRIIQRIAEALEVKTRVLLLDVINAA